MPYFDHNATTFLAPEVAETLGEGLREVYGNASSTHAQGQLARRHLEAARRRIGAYLDVSPAEVIFTSGGTESNNLAIAGLLRAMGSEPKHAITSAIEHPSVLEVFRQLEREGIEVTYVPVGASGVVEPEAVECALRAETVLISIMHANNETGTIQPLETIGKLVAERRRAGQRLFLHSDGVQACGKIRVDLAHMGIDLYSISGHKIFGPKGIGALVARKATPLERVQLGGQHERGRRAGTENVPAAMALARALDFCDPAASDWVRSLRDRFENNLHANLPAIEIHGAGELRLPNTSSVRFPGVAAETLVIALDRQGMAVSTGSACSSGSVEPSHVLLAMGKTRAEARSSVRFSFGRYNTSAEIDSLSEAVAGAVNRLRTHVGTEQALAG
jgi:cysteine desulfurase